VRRTFHSPCGKIAVKTKSMS